MIVTRQFSMMRGKKNYMRTYFRGDDGKYCGPLIIRSPSIFQSKPIPDTVVMYEVGRFYRQAGIPEEAEKAFRNFIENNPDNYLVKKAEEYIKNPIPETVIETDEDYLYRTEVVKSNGDYSVLHVFGPKQLEGDLRILLPKGYRRISPTDYHRLTYTNEADIHDSLIEALELQKKAHVHLRNTNNNFTRYLIEIKLDHIDDAINAYFEDRNADLKKAETKITNAKKYRTEVCSLIEKIVDKESDKTKEIKELIGRDATFELIQPLLNEMSDIFDKPFPTGQDFKTAFADYKKKLEDKLKDSPKKYQKKQPKIMKIATVPSSVFSDLREVKEKQRAIDSIVGEFDGYTELNFKESHLWIYILGQNGIEFRRFNM